MKEVQYLLSLARLIKTRDHAVIALVSAGVIVGIAYVIPAEYVE